MYTVRLYNVRNVSIDFSNDKESPANLKNVRQNLIMMFTLH